MKKFFLFAAALVAAMTVNAEQIFWTAPIAKADLADGQTFSDGGLILTVTDEADKFEVDANNASFGDAEAQIKFTHRLKTGGKSQVKDGGTSALSLEVPADGKLYIYARTGSSSADRAIKISQDEALLNQTLSESNAIEIDAPTAEDPTKKLKVHPVYSVDVKAGDVAIEYPDGAVNFYGFSFGAPLNPQGIEDINDEVKAVKYFENGQLVIKKNGVKYNALGAQL